MFHWRNRRGRDLTKNVEPRSVLLCGSVPLASAAAVFDAGAQHLGDRLRRVPDGETGERTNWIAWQHKAFAGQAALEPLDAPQRDYQLRPPWRLKSGASAADVTFGDLGFADAAAESYAQFRARRDAGGFLPDARFQVCLPTPFAPVYAFTDYDSQDAVYPRYEAAMLAELDRIVSAIPAGDLAVQWDVATEMSLFERVYPAPMDDPDNVLMARLCRLGDAVPDGVELGYHLCYGSMNNRHWKEPADLGKLVWVANGLAAGVARDIDWVHMPVPVDRDDDAYFAPFAGLRLAPETELYLGLLHLTDGVDGARRRMAAAQVEGLLALHRAAAS